MILSPAKTPPFEIDRADDVDESLRLKYRYLHLRSKDLQDAIALRHQVMQEVRGFLNEHHFLEIETPLLIRSTPGGSNSLCRVALTLGVLRTAPVAADV